jgi:GTP-binding protein EngB required for normal cell division
MPNSEQFNEAQQRRLLATASYVDKLLIEIEQVLSASESGGFPKYRNPLTPAQVRVVRDYSKRIRQQLVRVLADLGINLPPPRFDSTHSIRVTLQFVEIALEEIAPERLTGYGSVPDSLVRPLAGGLQEIKGIVRQLDSYISQQAGADLSSRISRLPEAVQEVELLKELSSIIERHGLVEFRAPLAQLIEKMENPTYEIAFFGRVSSGKSSLLNRIIGIDLLPTGVTPVTSVPTRVKNGPAPKLLTWTAEGNLNTYSVDRLPDFVTDVRNPGNEKRITRLVVEYPLPMLPDEVILVDTPGLGSLALEGAEETLAYLPRCDLGVVLIDALSHLQSDDVNTLDALCAASIPSLVVLSKLDLISEQDRETLLDYVRGQLVRQLGTEIPVAPLSSRPELRHLLENWIRNEIAPRVADARRLSQESNQRKIRSLGQRILHALEITAKASSIHSGRAAEELRNTESQLRAAASTIEKTRDECFRITDRIRGAGDRITAALAEAMIALWQKEQSAAELDTSWITKQVNQAAQIEAQQVVNLIQMTATQLEQALETAAKLLANGEREEQFGLQKPIKEMPGADFVCPQIHLKRPLILSLSPQMARSLVRRQLEFQIGAAITDFFSSYGRVLELWLRGTMDSLAAEFETHADIYRTQLQRLTAAGGAQENAAGEDLFESITSLRKHLEIEEFAEEVASKESD